MNPGHDSLERALSETWTTLRLAKNVTDQAQIQPAVVDLVSKLDTILSIATFKSHHSTGDFFKVNSDKIVEILKLVAELLEQVEHDHELIIKFSQTVTSFAESTCVFSSSDSKSLNKLVELLIGASETAALTKSAFEVCRAMGSLIYQNSYKLTDSNLSRLLEKSQNWSSSLLNGLRDRIETEYQCTGELNQDRLESLKRLDLITAQLVCNLTIPGVSDTQADPTATVSYHYVNEKYKQKCSELVVRIINFHRAFNTQSLVDNEDFKQNRSKILCKCLQSYENLFLSIKPATSSSETSWLRMNDSTSRLGDILAVCKELSFYGLTKIAKNKSLVINTSLEPSHVHESLISNKPSAQTANSADEEEREEEGINYGDAKSRNNKSKQPAYQNRSPKKPYQAPAASAPPTENGKFRSNYKKTPVKTNKSFTSNDSNNKPTESVNYLSTNSLQCLKQNQVPLAVTSKSMSGNVENLDSSIEMNSGSSFQIEKSNAMVRVTSLAVLLTIFQSLENKVVLSYWQSFIGSSGPNELNLIWSVKYDQSPKVRLIASQALATYLECVRAFFTITASEDSSQPQFLQSQQQQASFLPISHTIAYLIRQLHRDLVVSLCQREHFAVNQLHLLKCLRCLIKSTPYTKLRPGLVYKLILNLNILLNQKSKYKDMNNTMLVNELLNCLEMILTNNSQMMETHLALLATASIFASNQEGQPDLSNKLEQLKVNYKLPVLTKMPVTYFYDGNTNFFFSNKSSLNSSALVSGQQTPSLHQSFNDLISDEDSNPSFSRGEIGNGKPWLVDFCVQNARMTGEGDQPWRRIGPSCLSLLIVICSKYFDVMRKEAFLDEISRLFMDNINYSMKVSNPAVQEQLEQMKQKTLKLLEEFARCIATEDMRQATGLDLNDCCKFWSSLLNQSKLVSEILSDEQHYLLSSSACDCLASIGSSIFELLPFNNRVYCLTNLLHRTHSHSTLIRAASSRSLGVYVTFGSLKEDQNFLSDLSLTLINLLSNDANNLVRQKAAWSMSNLSEVLIENALRLGRSFTQEFNLTTWQRLLDTASQSCVKEGDKVKSYLVRTLGNLINYISFIDNDDKDQITLTEKQIEVSVTNAINALCMCRTVKMLKVKWNLSYSIGVAMRQFSSLRLVSVAIKSKWLAMFYDTLLELFTQSSNFKVRINACIALVSVNLNENSALVRSGAGLGCIYLKLWLGLVETFSKLKYEAIDADNELQHKNNLVHQLCKLLTYLCKYLKQEDLEHVKLECLNRLNTSKNVSTSGSTICQNELRQYLVGYINSIHFEVDNYKTEIQFYNEALTQLNLLSANKRTSVDEDCINLLKNILQKPVETTSSLNDSDHSSNETEATEYRKKFPFSQVYD